MVNARQSCGCVERCDSNGRESVSLCTNCAAERLERHEAARRSASHVWREQQAAAVIYACGECGIEIKTGCYCAKCARAEALS